MKKIILSILGICVSLMSYADSYGKQDFTIDGPNGKLYSVLEFPGEVQKDVKFPLVIICHGFTGNLNTPVPETLASCILESGMAVLRFDFDGHGKSEGKFEEMTVPKEIEDLRAVIDWAKDKDWVESISLVGHSQGGVVVSMTAGELSDSVIKAEVLMAPAAILREDALRGFIMGKNYDPYNVPASGVELNAASGDKKLILGKQYIESAQTLPIFETAGKYNGPTLIVHGTHDTIAPYTTSQHYKEVIANSTLYLVEGDDHSFSGTLKPTCEYIAGWLKQILKPAQVDPVRI